MGSLVGHVAHGSLFLFVGFWHLFNHIKCHSLHPTTYIALPWFPTPKLRYLELVLMMVGCSISIVMELFVDPSRHQPFDLDGTIPSNHLHYFEHASIAFSFFIYAAFAIALDRARPPGRHTTMQLLGALAFWQEFLLFHLHSTDHVGVEGQFHWLLQLIVAVSFATTLISIGCPQTFIVPFVRSASIAFQGVWFIVMGYALWTPAFIAKGCFMNLEDGRYIVRCHDQESLDRAKSLVNVLFSWFTSGFAVLVMMLYLFLVKKYPESPEYFPVIDNEDEDLEAQKKKLEMQNFAHRAKGRQGWKTCQTEL